MSNDETPEPVAVPVTDPVVHVVEVRCPNGHERTITYRDKGALGRDWVLNHSTMTLGGSRQQYGISECSPAPCEECGEPVTWELLP